MASDLTQSQVDQAQKLLAAFHKAWGPHGYMPRKDTIEALEKRIGITVKQASDLVEKAQKMPGAKTIRHFGKTITKLHPSVMPDEVMEMGKSSADKAEKYFKDRDRKGDRMPIKTGKFAGLDNLIKKRQKLKGMVAGGIAKADKAMHTGPGNLMGGIREKMILGNKETTGTHKFSETYQGKRRKRMEGVKGIAANRSY